MYYSMHPGTPSLSIVLFLFGRQLVAGSTQALPLSSIAPILGRNPAGHFTHLVCPDFGCALPGGHLMHSFIPDFGAMVPGEHFSHTGEFGNVAEPGGLVDRVCSSHFSFF